MLSKNYEIQKLESKIRDFKTQKRAVELGEPSNLSLEQWQEEIDRLEQELGRMKKET